MRNNSSKITSVLSSRGMFRVAAVQATPVFLNRDATLDVAAKHIQQAGDDGADLVVFPESFVPGYPAWVWRKKPGEDKDWYARFESQAVHISERVLEKACTAAKLAKVWVALGITERSATGSLYNSVVYINKKGKIAGLHRKLMPTGPERQVWAQGQDDVLTVVDIGGVKVGSLICWENYMPLARAALYEKGIDILLAPTWDNSDVWVPTLRHIAKEGRIFVVGVTSYMRGNDVPRDLSEADNIYGGAEDFLSKGNTTIVAPGGEILKGPLIGKSGVVTENLDLNLISAGRRTFDPSGHYARPDILTLKYTEPGH